MTYKEGRGVLPRRAERIIYYLFLEESLILNRKQRVSENICSDLALDQGKLRSREALTCSRSQA